MISEIFNIRKQTNEGEGSRKKDFILKKSHAQIMVDEDEKDSLGPNEDH